MAVGIEKLALYPGRLAVDALDLAAARGRDRAQMRDQVGVALRTVVPPWEDAVTLAVNAAVRVLEPGDRERIGLVIAATESAVDHSKSLSTWVHRLCGLPERCRGFEIKGACFAATAALKTAAAWVAEGGRPGARALVVSSDFTRYTGNELDAVGGGCGVAMIVGDSPGILALEPDRVGCWTGEVADTFRPTARDEIVDSELSLYAYFDALEGAVEAYERATGAPHRPHDFRRHLYHAPFPGMPDRAHRLLLRRAGVTDPEEVARSCADTVADGLRFGQRLGSAYGASTFVSLLGHLHAADALLPGDPISIFAYGSGCQGEIYAARVGPEARLRVRALDLEAAVADRAVVSMDEFEKLERARVEQLERPDGVTPRDVVPELYARTYAGRGLLVLDRVVAHRRSYTWS